MNVTIYPYVFPDAHPYIISPALAAPHVAQNVASALSALPAPALTVYTERWSVFPENILINAYGGDKDLSEHLSKHAELALTGRLHGISLERIIIRGNQQYPLQFIFYCQYAEYAIALALNQPKETFSAIVNGMTKNGETEFYITIPDPKTAREDNCSVYVREESKQHFREIGFALHAVNLSAQHQNRPESLALISEYNAPPDGVHYTPAWIWKKIGARNPGFPKDPHYKIPGQLNPIPLPKGLSAFNQLLYL